MIIPRAGARAPRHPVAAAAIVAAGAIAGSLLGGAPANAAEDDPIAEPTVEMSLSVGDHGASRPDAPLSGTVTVDNGLDDVLSAAQLAVEIDRTPLQDAADIAAWLDFGHAEGAFDTVFTVPVEQTDAESAVQTPLFVPADEIAELEPGVYPMRASSTGATSDDGERTWNLMARTVLTLDDSHDAHVAVLVPITATPASGTLLDAEELTELTDVDGALTAQLDAVVGTAAVLAVDPAIPAAIRVLGEDAPESARNWLSRLEALPNEIFTLQLGDADAATQAHAGLPDLLPSPSFDVFVDTGDEDIPDDEASPSPSPAAVDPAPTDVTAIDGASHDILWPRSDLTADDLADFDAFVGGSALTVVPSNVTGGEGAGNARVGDSRVLVTDTGLSALLSDAAAEADPVARGDLLARATATLHFDDSRSGVVIGLDRDETRTRDALRDVIETSGAMALRTVQDTKPVEVTLTAEADAKRAGDLKRLLSDERDLADFATILEDPQLLLAPERLRILRLLAVSTPDADFDEAYAAHREDTAARLDSVGIQDYAGPIQLISANVDLPVWIRNDLPWPISLRLEIRPSDPRIDIEPFTEVQALASSNTKVQIPIAARVASGELQVSFELTSPVGVPIGSPQSADVMVRAEWENIGLAVLGGLIVLLLGFGILRTILRRRRDAKDAAAEASETPEASAAPDVRDAADEGDR